MYARYLKQREQTILDAAASGVALDAMLSVGNVDLDKITPQMAEAFHLAYPHEELSSLAGQTPEQLAGFVNAWKGKLFEVEVRDRLTAGEWVGDLHLEPGQAVELAASATQPGWDLAIHDADGSVVDHLQLKATESLAYVKHALEQYPDTHVLTTSEVTADAGDHLHGMVSTADISDDSLTAAVTEPLSGLLDSSVLDTLLPGLPLALIGLTEGYGVITGKRSSGRALKRAASRAGKGLLAGVIGWGISALFGDFTGVVGGVAARLLMGGEQDEPTIIEGDFQRMDELLLKASGVPQLLLPRYL